MLLHSSTDCKYVRVEHNIFRWETNYVHKDVVTPLADTDLLIFRRSLPKLVECHHHNRRTVLLQQCCMLDEQLLTHLQRYAIHDRLALTPLKTCKHDLKL